jgi:hypothetical protein
MINLAGHPDCDRIIRHELERARIEIVEGERRPREVPYTVTGRLNVWTFRRAWYYWVAAGQLPLDVAQRLYADPVGKTDVRVAGHCGCPPPEPPWLVYFDADGIRLLHDPDGKEAQFYADFVERGVLNAEQLAGKRFVPDAPAVAARVVVESYHIDSEVGLRLFADTLRSLPTEVSGG